MSLLDVVLLCPPGFEELVGEAAARELLHGVELHRSSGLVRAQTEASVQQLRSWPCATNAFAVIVEVPRSNLEQEVRQLEERLSTAAPPVALPKGTPLVRVHDDGRFVPATNRSALVLAEATQTWHRQQASGTGRSAEVWLIRRSGLRSSFLTIRLSVGKPNVRRGQLRPEVCAALARVESLRGAGLVLDPFAGSGAIGEACLEAGAKSVWLNDLDKSAVRKTGREGVRWTSVDFRKLRLAPGTVDAIVTDPPWGRNWTIRHGAQHLYSDIGFAAKAWLRPGGALVLLTGAPERAVEHLLEAGNLRCEMLSPVLVSGSRARIVRARKGRARRRR